MQDTAIFSTFLNRKRVQLTCEACGSTSWSMAEANAGLSLGLPVHQESIVPLPTAIVPAYALICQNCGNIRLHAAAIVNAQSSVPFRRERDAPGAARTTSGSGRKRTPR